MESNPSGSPNRSVHYALSDDRVRSACEICNTWGIVWQRTAIDRHASSLSSRPVTRLPAILMFTPKPTAGPWGLLLVSRCESDQGPLRADPNFGYTDHSRAIPSLQSPHLGRLPSAPDKRTCRTDNMACNPQPYCSFVRKREAPWKTVGAFPCVVRRSLGYDSKDLSEINYLALLLSRMSRTVRVSDHDASACSKFRHSVRTRAPRIARLPDMRWAQVNCAILCREDAGASLNTRD